MGQAKLRGSQEQRAESAKAKILALKPAYIVCNSCKHHITDVDVMDSRSLPGIDALFGGLCPTCKKPTFAMKGDPEAMATLAEVMSGSDSSVIVGSQEVTK